MSLRKFIDTAMRIGRIKRYSFKIFELGFEE